MLEHIRLGLMSHLHGEMALGIENMEQTVNTTVITSVHLLSTSTLYRTKCHTCTISQLIHGIDIVMTVYR